MKKTKGMLTVKLSYASSLLGLAATTTESHAIAKIWIIIGLGLGLGCLAFWARVFALCIVLCIYD